MPRTATVDRPDFHARRAYRIVVDAETAAEQTAKFEFVREGHSRAGVWIHGGRNRGIRIGAVHTMRWEFADPTTGAIRKKSSYSAVADATVANGTVSPALPAPPGWGHAKPLRRCCTAGGSSAGPGMRPGGWTRRDSNPDQPLARRPCCR
jgi:hypothetical protein